MQFQKQEQNKYLNTSLYSTSQEHTFPVSRGTLYPKKKFHRMEMFKVSWKMLWLALAAVQKYTKLRI